MASKKNAKKSSKSGPNLSDFVRSMPNAKAGEVVEAAKKQGLKLSAGLVYAVRSAAKGGKKAAKGKPGRPKGSKLTSAVSSDLSHLKRAVFQHGFDKVESFLSELKKSVGL